MWVARYGMGAGQAFGAHQHEPAQVVWAPDGVLTATVDSTTFVLTPAQALWIPSGAEHDVAARSDAEAHFVSIDPDERTLGWTAPTLVMATPLVRELFAHLAEEVDPVERRHAEAPTAWRAQARLCAAMELLAVGHGPAQVAARVGYTSPRAFATAFRRAFGTSPQRYADTHRAA